MFLGLTVGIECHINFSISNFVECPFFFFNQTLSCVNFQIFILYSDEVGCKLEFRNGLDINI